MPLTVGRFGADDPDREPRFKLSVLEQLDVFRKRLINSAIGVGVGVLIAFGIVLAIPALSVAIEGRLSRLARFVPTPKRSVVCMPWWWLSAVLVKSRSETTAPF